MAKMVPTFWFVWFCMLWPFLALAESLDHQTSGFSWQWDGHSLQVFDGSHRLMMSSLAGMPFVAPAEVRDNAQGLITKRFSPRVIVNSQVLGEVRKGSATESSVEYIINLQGFCREFLHLSFHQIHSRALDLEVVFSGNRRESPYHSSCEGLSLALEQLDEENFVGLGTQSTLITLNGWVFTTLSQEQGHGRGLQPLTWLSNRFGKGTAGDETTSYHYVSHVISSAMRSFWVYARKHVHFDFRSPSMVRISPTEPFLRMRFNLGSDVKDLTREFAREFGTTKRLPDWVHKGAMMGLQGGEERIWRLLMKLKNLQARIGSVWIQDWLGSFQTMVGQRLLWYWQTDTTLYPNWKDFVARLGAQNWPVLSYFNPRIKENCSESCYFDEAAQNQYLVKDRLGQPYMIGNGGFDFAKIDLFNLEARYWLAGLMRKHFEDSAVKGWMADFSEALPFDARLADGSSGVESHNAYIYQWAKLNGQLIDEIDDGFVFMRGGVLGSHKYVHAFWLGDQLTTWDRYDGLHSTVVGLITSGLSGALVNHSDIGGLTNIRIPLVANIQRTKELFLRWTQLNAFTPIFRTHEGLRPQVAHQFDSDEETLMEFSRYSKIFASLYPYRQRLVEETQQGIPMVRGMFMEYPHIEAAWQIDDQFMLGDELIVAPILKPSETGRMVFLPQGCWVDVFTQKIYDIPFFQKVYVEASHRHIPVFAKQGSQSDGLLREALGRYR